MANDLDIPAIADGQADGQWQTSNDADAALGNAFGDLFEVDFSGGNVTLTDSQFRSAAVFIADGLTANRTLTLPAVKRPFAVYNPDSTYSVDVTKGSTAIEVGPGQYGRFHTDGTTDGLVGVVSEVSTGGGAPEKPYDIPLSYAGGPPDASEIIGRVVVTRDIDFAADFAGSYGYIATNPTSSFAIDVKDDGSSIGTITVSTGGAFTFVTTSNTAKTVAAGSRIEFVAPGSADGTAADIAATLHGTVG